MVELSEVKSCPECGSSNVIYKKRDDEVVCKDCGMVFAELTPEQEKQFEDASDVI